MQKYCTGTPKTYGEVKAKVRGRAKILQGISKVLTSNEKVVLKKPSPDP